MESMAHVDGVVPRFFPPVTDGQTNIAGRFSERNEDSWSGFEPSFY
jgi:hypothetical protein